MKTNPMQHEAPIWILAKESRHGGQWLAISPVSGLVIEGNINLDQLRLDMDNMGWKESNA